MWTYEYINFNTLNDCFMRTLIVYRDGAHYITEYIKMETDDESNWIQFAESYIQTL
jgi:hypothetical protein